MSREEDETTRRLEAILKRSEAEPETVPLRRCPGCGDFGLPPDCRSYAFCLLCQWRGALSEVAPDPVQPLQ
jgi:hypothetical protein